MNVSLDPSKLSSLAPVANAAFVGEVSTPATEVSTKTKIIRGTGLTVSSANVDKLAEKLLVESDTARERAMLSSFSSMGALLAALLGNASLEQQEVLKNLDTATNAYTKAKDTEAKAQKDLADAQSGVVTAEGDLTKATKSRDAAKKAREAIAQKPGESEEAFNNRVGKADKTLSDAEENLATAQAALNTATALVLTRTGETKTAAVSVATASVALSSAVSRLDTNSYKALTDAVRRTAFDPSSEELLKEDEEEETAGDASFAELSPFDAVRYFLMQEAQELLEVQEGQFSQHV